MRSLFRSFKRFGLDYLLISGQASVLYGAATFSEDVDIWIRPLPGNAHRLLMALAACRARIHRLTPPLTVRNMTLGHGFHFVIPGRPVEMYLDVMGKPPRAGTFAAAKRRARAIATDWGTLPVVHPMDLVEIKKTRRLADFDVITNLALLYLAEQRAPGEAALRWAAENCFRPEERAAVLARLGSQPNVAECARRIASEIVRLQARDRAYWSPILDDLRVLRRRGRLLPDGARVASLRGGVAAASAKVNRRGGARAGGRRR